MIDTQIGQTTLGELIPYIVMSIIFLGILAFCIYMIIITSIISIRRKKYLKQLKSQGMLALVQGRHLMGLPVTGGMQCVLFYYPDRIEINANENIFKIAMGKVKDVIIDANTTVENHYVPRPDKNPERIREYSTSMRLVISYVDDRNVLRHLNFDVVYDDKRARKFANVFNANNADRQRIKMDL